MEEQLKQQIEATVAGVAKGYSKVSQIGRLTTLVEHDSATGTGWSPISETLTIDTAKFENPDAMWESADGYPAMARALCDAEERAALEYLTSADEFGTVSRSDSGLGDLPRAVRDLRKNFHNPNAVFVPSELGLSFQAKYRLEDDQVPPTDFGPAGTAVAVIWTHQSDYVVVYDVAGLIWEVSSHPETGRVHVHIETGAGSWQTKIKMTCYVRVSVDREMVRVLRVKPE